MMSGLYRGSHMHKSTTFCAAAIIALAAALSGCAAFEKCAPENCSVDKQVTGDVNDALAQHRELGPAGTVRVQTINGVVYLTGTVNSDFEIRTTEAIVRQIANVKDVVNNLNARSNSR
jgi:osmotically-inducible protein OsmY